MTRKKVWNFICIIGYRFYLGYARFLLLLLLLLRDICFRCKIFFILAPIIGSK